MVALLKRYISVVRLLNIAREEMKFTLNDNNYPILLDLLLDHHMFFLCISASELYTSIFSTNIKIAYTSLAYSYQKTNFLFIAEYYYTKAGKIAPY